MSAAKEPRRGRLGMAVVAGLCLAVPAGWVMTPLAVLPFFLGLYFFLLFGLLIGAMMYRLALPAAPVSRRTALLVGLVPAVSLWGACLLGEYRYFYRGAFRAVQTSTRLVLTSERSEQVRTAVVQHARDRLARDYSPGGFLGYARWATVSGSMDIPRFFDQQTVTYRLRGAGWKWVVRVVLSLVLTAGSMASQVLGLTRPPAEPAEPAELSSASAP